MDHYILLCKLNCLDFGASVAYLFETYLLRRFQLVKYGGVNSFAITKSSGVPQGSNMGPLLFLLYINHLNAIIDENRLLFADDAKVYSSIISIDDCEVLQEQIDMICKCCTDNKLHLNISIYKVMSFSRRRSPIGFDYGMSRNLLARHGLVKDLGVLFTVRRRCHLPLEYWFSLSEVRCSFLTSQF